MPEESTKEARRYLCRYLEATRNLESLIAERERIESQICSLTANIDGGGGGSSSSDKMGDDVAKLCDIKARITSEIDVYRASREEVRRVISRVAKANPIWGQCLHYRYIDGRSPFTTAHDMGFSERNERRVHMAALRCAWRFI